MVSAAERRQAAKEKLAALDDQRRKDKKEREAAQEAKEAAKKAKEAEQKEAADKEAAAASKKNDEATSKAQNEAAASQSDKKKKKKRKVTTSGGEKVVDVQTFKPDSKNGLDSAPAGDTDKKKKKTKKRKAAEDDVKPDNEDIDEKPIKMVEGLKKNRTKVDLVPTDKPAVLDAVAYRDSHNIVCNDVEAPDPIQTFEAAEELIGDHFVQMLRDRGFFAPSPIQAQAWPLALAGRDVVGIAQTGSGKTLAYLLPVLVRLKAKGKPSTDNDPATPSALVLAPTRELIQQIASDVAKMAISINHRFVPCFGGVWKGDQLKQLGKGCDILLSTPGRLKDFMKGDKAKGHNPAADVSKVTYLVLDEADAMLAMGFMPQVQEIVKCCVKAGTPEQALAGTARQTLFFTATWPQKVKAASRMFTNGSAAQLRIGQGVGQDKLTANQNVRQIVQVVEYYDKIARLQNVLTSELKAGDTCVVFCGTKGRVEYVVDELNKSSVVDWCEGIHSGKEQWVRDTSLEHFRWHTANGDARAVLVATDVAARGLDIPGVALVVVYDLNGWNGELNIDSYVHRIGRTGRAGKMGRAFTFVETKDKGLPDLVKLLEDAGQKIPQPLQDLEIGERAPLGDKDDPKRGKKRKAEDAETDDEDGDDGDEGGEEEGEDDDDQKSGKKGKGKGKNKGKGKEKGKAKGKDKGKDKGGDKGKGKGKGKGGKDKGKSGKGKVGKDKGKGKKGKDKGKGKSKEGKNNGGAEGDSTEE